MVDRLNLEGLRPYATPRELEVVDAVTLLGSNTKAAKALGVNRRSVDRAMEALRRRAALRGYAPEHDMTRPAPDGYVVKGTSTLYDADGNVALQWVKTDRDREQVEAIHKAIFDAMRDQLPRTKPAKPPARTDDALLNLYVLTDLHLGMYSWAEETGADWDTEIAEALLVDWFTRAVTAAPAAQTAVLAQLGDLLHFDGLKALTPESGHLLDADTRFAKVVRVVIRALRRVVALLLAKHERVHVVIAEGNHDPVSSVWLREWFAVLYEGEPRVTVDQSPSPYYAIEHGDTALFLHHGHLRKPEQIADVLAAKFRPVFGRTRHAYAHLGHRHKAGLVESSLMLVESHRTLAAPDAFAARGGWMSGRSASVITYHRVHGEVGRVVISPEMAQAG